MTPKKIINTKRGPERIIQDKIMAMLRSKGWFVIETHGNAYQNGFPDLFASNAKYGQRWIECKHLGKYEFTAAQLEKFPQFVAAGSGIWIMVDATDAEYDKLMKPCNWWMYLYLLKGT